MGAIKSIWNNFIFYPILNILLLTYYFSGQNLGIAVTVITVVIRLLLTPSMYKQVTMGFKLRKITPKLKELQKKYKGNNQKLAAEQSKLYKEAGYNPIGCFGNLLIQLPIMIALYQAVLLFTKENLASHDGIYGFTRNLLFPNGVENFIVNSQFLGLDLLIAPSVAMQNGWFTAQALPYLILVIVMVVSQLISTYLNTKFMGQTTGAPTTALTTAPGAKPKDKKDQSPEDMMQNMTKYYGYILPLIIAYSLTKLPAVISLYWVVQSLIGIVQMGIIVYVWRKRHPGEK